MRVFFIIFFIFIFNSIKPALAEGTGLLQSIDDLKSCSDDDDTDACDGQCATNESGAIIIASNGLPYDADNSTSYRDSCNMIPDFYRVTLYKGGLCISDPYTSESTVDYTTNCDLFFNDANGKVITLTNQGDGTATASPSLVENGINLGIKTYTHAFMVMSNHLQIKHQQAYDFTGTETSDEMRGGDVSSAALPRLNDQATGGIVCWTVDRTSTFSNLDGVTGTNHGEVILRTGNGNPSEASTKCGSVVDETYDYATEIIESFGEASGNWGDSEVTAKWPYAESSIDIGGTKAAILLQSNLTEVANTMENAVAMLYAVNLTNPLEITENTNQFNIEFGLSGSVSIDFTTQNSTPEYLMISKHGADPVDIRFSAN